MKLYVEISSSEWGAAVDLFIFPTLEGLTRGTYRVVIAVIFQAVS